MINKIKVGLAQPFVKRMAVYALTDGLSKAVPFLIMPIIAMYMKPAEFGIASNYMVFTQMIGAFIGLGTQSYFSVDYYRTDVKDRAKLLTNLVAINLIITLISLVVILCCSGYIRDLFVVGMQFQLLGSLMMFFSAFTDLFVIYLRMEEKVRQYSRFQILTSLSSALLSVLFIAVFLMSWQGRVYALFLSNIILFIVAIIAFAKKDMLKFTYDKALLKDALKFGIPLLPHRLSTWIRSGFDRIVITKKEGINATGVYSFGSNISNAVTLFVNAFSAAFTPYIYKQLKIGEDDAVKDVAIKKKIVKTCYVASAIFGVLLVISYAILALFIRVCFDASYRDAILYIPFFFVSIFFGFIYNLVSMFVFYSKKTRFLGIFTMTIAIVQAASVIPLVNWFGTMGAAYSLLIGSFLKAFIIFIYSQKVYPMPWFYNSRKYA
jgi:O-antigen/teichoic acid export membrane protein